MILLILMLLTSAAFQGYAAEPSSWHDSLEEGFSSTINASALDISLGETLTIEVSLTYPPTFKPEVDAMIQQLLSYGGFDPPPFYLVRKNIGKPVKTSNLLSLKFEVTLAPQLPGKHFITFQTIPFTSLDGNLARNKEIISGLFEINVFTPPANFQYQLLISPPMPLSQELPVTLSTANRLQFIENPQDLAKASAQSLSLLRSKKLPWQVVPALFVILTITLIVKGPEKAEGS